MFKNRKNLKKNFMFGVEGILARDDLEKATPAQLYAISQAAFRFADADAGNAALLRKIGLAAHHLAYLKDREALGK